VRNLKFKNAQKVEYKLLLKRPAPKWNASGLCDSPDTKNPEIWVDPSLKDRRLMAVIIEELSHAHFWDKSEKEVRKFSSNLRNILYKLGWRR